LYPDIIHLHDWQTAAVAPLYNDMYKKLNYNKSKTVFTIHNIEYQGRCSPNNLSMTGLQAAKYLVEDKMQDSLYPEAINLLKVAIVYSDYITTVSPNYTKEVLTPEGGRGLKKMLKKYQKKFKGILNGLDYSFWNPKIDRYLPSHSSSREMPAN